MGLTGFRKQAVALAVLLTTLAVGALVVVSYVWLSRVTLADAHTLAHSRAAGIATDLAVKDGRVMLSEPGLDVLDSSLWVYVDGVLVDGSRRGSTAATLARVAALGTTTQVINESRDGFLLHAEPLTVAGHRVVVIVRVDLAPYEASEENGLRLSLALGAITVALAGALAWLVVGRAMRVVHNMSALAEEWGDHDPGQRFNLGEPKDEFGELARTFDALLDRVEAALADERRLTDEIAHELRTPLTALRAEAQLAEMGGTSIHPAVVLAEVDRMGAAVSTILGAARQRLDPSSCDVREAVARAIAGRDVRLAPGPSARADASIQTVSAILSPLFDNAVRHAISEASVTIQTTADHVVITVFDDGSGFAIEDAERAFEPGWTGGAGHGLGLALVRRIASAAGVNVRAVADGRGHVEVILPRMPPTDQRGPHS